MISVPRADLGECGTGYLVTRSCPPGLRLFHRVRFTNPFTDELTKPSSPVLVAVILAEPPAMRPGYA